MMQRYYFFCNHVSFSNGFWVSVLRPPPPTGFVGCAHFQWQVVGEDFVHGSLYLVLCVLVRINTMLLSIFVHLVDGSCQFAKLGKCINDGNGGGSCHW